MCLTISDGKLCSQFISDTFQLQRSSVSTPPVAVKHYRLVTLGKWTSNPLQNFKTVPNAKTFWELGLDWLWGWEVVGRCAIYKPDDCNFFFYNWLFTFRRITHLCNRFQALYIIDLFLWIWQWGTDIWLTYTTLVLHFCHTACCMQHLQHVQIK